MTKPKPEKPPEIATLPLDQADVAQLDSLCSAYRSVQVQASALEKTKAAVMADLKPLAESLNLPNRTLGPSWDLRRVERVTEKINEDRLKMALLQAGFTMRVPCPTTQLTDDEQETVIVCPRCGGTGISVLEGLTAVNFLVADCTDETITVSWSVYAREVKKDDKEGSL